ncbi:hypothetical protein C8Q75DRAFT_40742 [Abortiporus biennis]|nr:hypothetical protein C8Q75DRAFT_40742 [Abortiporus biennis]
MFYPDNAQRATRLQQLVDSMANMQTDIKHSANEIDKKNTAIRPKIDALLKENGIDTIDDLIVKSTSKMTPKEKKQFESLIEAAKKSKAGFEITYFIAQLLFLPEGLILTGQGLLMAGRFVLRLSVIQGIAQFFNNAESTVAVAGKAASQLGKAATEAEKLAKYGGVAGEAGAEVKEATSLMKKVGTALKVLGAIGFVVTIIVGAIELIEGADQKAKLIEAIHNCQPARLCIAYFKREAANLTQQLELMQAYMESLTGPDKNKAVAATLAKKIVNNIKSQNSTIKYDDLETELEAQDKSADNYYGSDDLPFNQVVAHAQASK